MIEAVASSLYADDAILHTQTQAVAHLAAHAPIPYRSPTKLQEMIDDDKLGEAVGEGFYKYN